MYLTCARYLQRRVRRLGRHLLRDNSGLAAVEFAMILPLMLVMFFGTIEVTSGVAVNRKVTIVTRTLSDLTSQASSVTDAQLANFFAASAAIMTPYSATPVRATVSQVKVDGKTLKATIVWSKGAKPHGVGDTVSVPDGLKPVAPASDIYLIWSEVSYLFKPLSHYTVTDVNLADETYTRPRQSACVMYNNTAC